MTANIVAEQLLRVVLVSLLVAIPAALFIRDWLRRRSLTPEEREAEEAKQEAERQAAAKRVAQAQLLQIERENRLNELAQKRDEERQARLAALRPLPFNLIRAGCIFLALGFVLIVILGRSLCEEIMLAFGLACLVLHVSRV